MKAQTKPAPLTPMFVTATFDPPAAALLVKVTVPELDSVPDGLVMVSGFGEIDTAAFAATPVPVSVTTEPVTVAPV